ncbi:MAG: BACON domain-containing protein [Bacteroidales bacterium]|nr:BACON domain-containing protein [Bacteroidales bacterium]
MKQTLISFFVWVLLFLITACEPEEPQISIDPPELLFTSDAGSCEINVHANCEWEAAFPPDAFFRMSPSSGKGDAVVTVSVPDYDVIEGRAFSVGFTANRGGHLTTKFLMIRQQAKPGWASFSHVRCADDWAQNLPAGQLSPIGGCLTMTIMANNDWTISCDQPVRHISFWRGYPGGWDNAVYYDANAGGEPIVYRFTLDCQTQSGGGGETLVVEQPPMDGSLTLLSITPSNDGKTIPAEGADVVFRVKSNTYWILYFDPFFTTTPPASWIGDPGEWIISVSVPPLDTLSETEKGLVRHFWLHLHGVKGERESEAVELIQK